MQDSKLLNKTITISDKIIKDSQYGQQAKLKDENGLTYNVYEKKRDGTTSTAWMQLSSIKVGTLVQIGYVEEAKQYEGKGYMARTIRTFDLDVANGIQNSVQNSGGYQGSQTQESSNGEHPTQSQTISGRDYPKEAVGKCQSLFLQAYIQSGHSISEAMLQVGQAKKLAESVVYGHTVSVAPDIQDIAEQMASEEPDVSDVPW